MGELNNTPNANRLHIGVFGRTNSGKSSFVNKFAGQQISIVSNVAGTTTDPVYKAMEINPLGPCVLIDTAGLEDYSRLGQQRMEKTSLVMDKTDIAVIVLPLRSGGMEAYELELNLAKSFRTRKIPVLLVFNLLQSSVKTSIAPLNSSNKEEGKNNDKLSLSTSSISSDSGENNIAKESCEGLSYLVKACLDDSAQKLVCQLLADEKCEVVLVNCGNNTGTISSNAGANICGSSDDIGYASDNLSRNQPDAVELMRNQVRQALTKLMPEDFGPDFITGNLIREEDLVLLVMPQDIQAPKNRLILPQVQTIRELLDRKCTVVCTTTDKMVKTLSYLSEPPRLIITDSQAFGYVYEHKPPASMLTSFSVLFAAYKGDIDYFIESARYIDKLTEQSRVLIAECCTHAPLAEDIGRVKIPNLLRKRFGQGLTIDVVSGTDFPENTKKYDLIIQCGGCMFNRRYILSRIAKARERAVPMTNYGVTIAHLKGILDKIVLT